MESIKVPEGYERIANMEILKPIDSSTLGYYYLVVLAGLNAQNGGFISLRKIHQMACEKGYCSDRFGRTTGYGTMHADIASALKKAGIEQGVSQFYQRLSSDYMNLSQETIKKEA